MLHSCLKTCRRRPPIPRQCRRHTSSSRPFVAGDHVILRPTKDRTAAPLLTKPLAGGARHDTHRGTISHDDILGKSVRDVVQTTAGKLAAAEYRLHDVKLEEYVRLTKRLVTPLYPQDAQLIVGLLDVHPNPPRYGEANTSHERLELLEAGTGHGALTLHLSRAVHAANAAPPRASDAVNKDDEDHVDSAAWKASRRAVIHTIEVNAKYSAHASKIVRGFRHGMYFHNVDFHVGNVSEWTSGALAERNGEPFLSHAFLDLPGTEEHLATVAKALKIDGSLIVFCPSITQIMACFETVKREEIPLDLEKVIELGVNGGTGGREWDVRAVKPRAAVKATAAAGVTEDDREDSGVEVGGGDNVKPFTGDDGWKMVCRPKVGETIVGGGFLGVFRKKRT
ncbi:hypothetical protein LTR62_003267 [Meristemomyces frigidus]|uniref:tRNA (adenine(58)-N(1))-methyltransferase catalytic subunit TRM61 n=1 Tax=Meristemomyces frigidus TaxID=1508187 RepID=A0AAN7YH47_9PEZI|nr:hypothetical protein LTR62_003267 [Meristemomyces frigidus]